MFVLAGAEMTLPVARTLEVLLGTFLDQHRAGIIRISTEIDSKSNGVFNQYIIGEFDPRDLPGRQ